MMLRKESPSLFSHVTTEEKVFNLKSPKSGTSWMKTDRTYGVRLAFSCQNFKIKLQPERKL